jgi:hypothetical protein
MEVGDASFHSGGTMSEHSRDASPEAPSQGVTRRELFQVGNALALPMLFGSATSLTATAGAGPLVAVPQIYQSIGVEPVINCRGTFTIIGGSVELPEVLRRWITPQGISSRSTSWPTR